MSCFYKALPKIIPQLILAAGEGQEIGIVSPWIHNVMLLPPQFGSGNTLFPNSQIEFKEFLVRIVRDFDFRIIFIVRPDDNRTMRALESVLKVSPVNVILKEFEYTHAKMIVTPDFALETTANLLPTSLYRNIESCTIVPNRFGDSRKYLKDKLGILI